MRQPWPGIAGFEEGRGLFEESRSVGRPYQGEEARKWILSSSLQKEHGPADTLILAQQCRFQTSDP